MARDRLTALLPTQQEIRVRIEYLESWSEAPVLIYGAGTYSSELRDFLAFHGVHVRGAVVDPQFLTEDLAHQAGIFPADEIPPEFASARIVLGFVGDPTSASESLRRFRANSQLRIEIVDCRRWQKFGAWSEDVGSIGEMFQPLYAALTDIESCATLGAFVRAKLLFDQRPLEAIRSERQYFPADLPMFTPTRSDVFVDGGAYVGDTLADFLRHEPAGCREYLAFEPDPSNRESLEEFVALNRLDWVEVLPAGLWSTSGRVPLLAGQGSTSRVDERGRDVDVIALDDLGRNVSAIKLDVEGAESAALAGSAESIARCGPRLAIAAYHCEDDLRALPTLIQSLRSDYRLYLRFHGVYSEELVLYACAEESR